MLKTYSNQLAYQKINPSYIKLEKAFQRMPLLYAVKSIVYFTIPYQSYL